MRKDVKIGLAIAGVLFVVLIVYAFVPKHDTTQTAGTGDNGTQQTEGDTADNSATPAPSADGAPAPTDSASRDAGVAAKGNDADSNVFDPNYKGTANAGAAAAKADGAGGNTDWFKTFDEDKIVAVESHPSLIAQTKTPTPGTAKPAAQGDRAPTDVDRSQAGTPVVPNVGDAPNNLTTTPGRPNGAAGGNAAPGKERGKAGSERTIADPPSSPLSNTAGRGTHVIQKDETFSTIAKAVYGKKSYYLQIQKANPTVNPNKLKPGTTIVLPDISAAEASSSAKTADAAKPAASRTEKSGAGASSERAVDSATEYRVQQGDSLYKISVKLYGNGSHADELYDTNSAAIGSDKAKLKVGMVLKLHDAPRVKQAR